MSLLEKHFDRDFPRHYCRKIKSISVSLPAVVGSYQNVQASFGKTVVACCLQKTWMVSDVARPQGA
ncbi:hypothetical protein [Psychromonas sp. MB-3u-54]|uniref:Tc toxin subunit A-related protein n=1 Tax=Psychromonas sp. MB-3u-54 TaxID=2058319 RepID=UPI0012FF5643